MDIQLQNENPFLYTDMSHCMLEDMWLIGGFSAKIKNLKSAFKEQTKKKIKT
jgi:hypothetical protein